ncbi:hypothetical protein P691DRAFT_788791 [Macrolepiota fuliginosa MF-IS2]|uniref:F-box domain-containing protein n=1 Tax=Macrolepiota fuliginosa MF-IS2 TaxID=1400762 RepID=A0A9P6C6S5_9AGAR|nr:hypothetical protein P691DRAFT_788791 [Macrolepiota fuliginosa MF-IS2]
MPDYLYRGVLCEHKKAPQGPDDDYEVLLQRADHWNDIAQRAIDERARWLREANALRSATSSLPNEILATIFKFACPPIDFRKRVFCRGPDDSDGDDDDDDGYRDDDWPIPSREKEDLSYRRFPMVLGAVSNRWREVAWSTPGLWNTLAIEPTYRTVRKEATRLQFYLTNAKSFGFVLDIDLRRYNEETEFFDEESPPLLEDIITGPEKLSLEPLKAVVFGDMAKNIQTLRIAGVPESWIPDINRKALNVVDLCLSCDGHHLQSESSLVLQKFESLHHIHLVDMFPLKTSPLPSNITTICLRGVQLDDCIRTLLQCTSLVEFYVRYPRDSSTSNPIPALLQEPLIRSTMKRFGWDNSGPSNSWNSALLQMVRFPNLRYLEWTDGPRRGTPKPEVDFFSNLPPSLTSLTLFNNATTSRSYEQRAQLRRLFIHLPQIKKLTLLKCHDQYAQIIFVLLSRGPDDKCPSSPNDFVFPKLRQIVYRFLGHISRRYVDSEDGRWSESDDYYDSGETTASRNDSDAGTVTIYPKPFMEVVLWRSKIMAIPYFRLKLTECRLERVRVVWERFRGIVKGGLRLEVVEDTKLVDWEKPI